jgi:hypothetical protein
MDQKQEKYALALLPNRVFTSGVDTKVMAFGKIFISVRPDSE